MRDKFDIITFDCYGTLIDWESGIVAAFQSEALNDGVKLAPEEIIAAYSAQEPVVESEPYRSYADVLSETARRVASRFGWQVDPTRASFLADSLPRWTPFPDTNPALERLATRYELGILSNVDDGLLAATRRHFTVSFELIVTAQQVKSYKPGPAHFKEALACTPEKRLLHAAQSYFHDVVPTSSLGIQSVWVNRHGSAADPGGPLPTYEVRNLTELADLMGV
jgi:2-haloacid dehalogenase/putative hydrolase of the HAD superfamily